VSTVFGYDAFGRVTAREVATGRSEAWTYEIAPEGAAAEHEIRADIEGLEFSTRIDGLGRVFREQSPGRDTETIVVDRSFDDRGRVSAESAPRFLGDPALTRSFSYDPLGRPRELVDFDASTRLRLSYDTPWSVLEEAFLGNPALVSSSSKTRRSDDAFGRLSRVIQYDELERALITTTKYDALDRAVEVWDPVESAPDKAAFCADLANRLPPECAIQRHKSEITYDSLGRRVQMIDPDAGTWRYRFDDAGLLIEQSDGNGKRITYGYDELQRVISKTLSPESTGALSATFEYSTGASSWGSLERVTSSGTSYAYGYDSFGRLAVESTTTTGRRFTNVYGYDTLDRLSSRTFPDGGSASTTSTTAAGSFRSSPTPQTTATATAARRCCRTPATTRSAGPSSSTWDRWPDSRHPSAGSSTSTTPQPCGPARRSAGTT
jgi:YD repeat-containing protein